MKQPMTISSILNDFDDKFLKMWTGDYIETYEHQEIRHFIRQSIEQMLEELPVKKKVGEFEGADLVEYDNNLLNHINKIKQ